MKLLLRASLAPLMRTTGGADCTVALFDLDGPGEKEPASIRYARRATLRQLAIYSREPTTCGSFITTGYSLCGRSRYVGHLDNFTYIQRVVQI